MSKKEVNEKVGVLGRAMTHFGKEDVIKGADDDRDFCHDVIEMALVDVFTHLQKRTGGLAKMPTQLVNTFPNSTFR